MHQRAAAVDTFNTANSNHTGMPQMTRCPRCYSIDLAGFDLAPKGEPLHFNHCRACEYRWWAGESGASSIERGTVLAHSAA